MPKMRGWLLFLMYVASDACNMFITRQVLANVSTGDPKTSSLSDDYKDIIQINRYSPAIRDIVAKVLKAITVFDCYDLKVMEVRPIFKEGGEYAAAAFDALGSLKRAQYEYTRTVSQCLILLRDMDRGFRSISETVTGINSNGACFVNETKFSEEDCRTCKDSLPIFKTKYSAKVEVRILILQMQETIPKQFLYYVSDILIVTAEAIRIMDKILTCHKKGHNDCESKDKTIAKFTETMNRLVQKEENYVKMIRNEKVKMQSLMAQLKSQVQSTMKLVLHCLQIKKESRSGRRATKGGRKIGNFEEMKKDLDAIARKYGLVFDNIESKDSELYTVTLVRPKKHSIGSRVATMQQLG